MDGDASPLEPMRLWLGERLRTAIIGEDAPPPDAYRSPRGDAGLFGPESVTWRVHGDVTGIIGGLRALLIQTLHPLAMAGVDQHSNFRADPLGRLRRTSTFIAVTTYGSTPAAERAIAAVRRVHERVNGIAPDGTPYRANDPDLIGWVHNTEVDSFARAYERYGRVALDPADRDRYVAEMAAVATRLGMEDPPRTWQDLQDQLDGFRPALRATPAARHTVRFLIAPPVIAPAARPGYGIVLAAAVAQLPPYARRALWLPMPPGVEPLGVRPAAQALVGVLRWAMTPSPRRDAASERAHAA